MAHYTRRLATGVCAATLIAALSFLAVPAASAATSGRHHHVRPVTHLAPRPRSLPEAVISGLVADHGGPVETAPQVYVDFQGWTSDLSVPLSVINPGDQGDEQFDEVSLQVNALGGTTPYAWSATSLPTGLHIDAFSGLIHGLIRGSALGNWTPTVKVTDSAGHVASVTFSWFVSKVT